MILNVNTTNTKSYNTAFRARKVTGTFEKQALWQEGKGDCSVHCAWTVLLTSLTLYWATFFYILTHFVEPLSMRLDLWSHHFTVNILGQNVPTGKRTYYRQNINLGGVVRRGDGVRSSTSPSLPSLPFFSFAFVSLSLLLLFVFSCHLFNLSFFEKTLYR